MPLLSGIAALAVLNPTMDLTAIDPQVDRQFAYVKTPPAVVMDDNPVAVQGTAVPPTPPILAEIPVVGQAAPAKVVEGTIAPRYYTTVADAGHSLGTLKGMDRKVSVNLNNVTAADALKWVGKQNVNYVVNLDTLPKSKISLNMKDVPLSEALSSIADVLGGHWQVKGSTLLFRGGFGFFSAPLAPMGQTRMFAPGQTFRFDTKAFEMPDMKTFKFDGKVLTPREFEKMHGEMGKHLHDFKFDKETMDKLHKELGTLGKMHDFKFDKDTMEKLHKELGSLGKLHIDGQELSKEQRAKFEKDLSIALKAKDSALLQLKDGEKLNSLSKFQALGFKKVDSAKLLKSLTAGQREIMKKQGFLKISDLTKEQKEMIFTDPKAEIKGDFSFILNLDGEKLTIKN